MWGHRFPIIRLHPFLGFETFLSPSLRLICETLLLLLFGTTSQTWLSQPRVRTLNVWLSYCRSPTPNWPLSSSFSTPVFRSSRFTQAQIIVWSSRQKKAFQTIWRRLKDVEDNSDGYPQHTETYIYTSINKCIYIYIYIYMNEHYGAIEK